MSQTRNNARFEGRFPTRRTQQKSHDRSLKKIEEEGNEETYIMTRKEK